MSVIQALRRLRLEDREFKASLSNIVTSGPAWAIMRPCLKKEEEKEEEEKTTWVSRRVASKDQKFVRIFKYPGIWFYEKKMCFTFSFPTSL